MSFTAPESEDVRRTCQACQERNARFIPSEVEGPALSEVEGAALSEIEELHFHRTVRASADTLCFECYRAGRDRGSARQVTNESAARPLYLPGDFRGRTLTVREIAHRQQMLAHLAAGGRA
jgi:hypothetical protein